MRTKVICLALCASLSALSVSAQAQQRAKVAKIGWLSSGAGLGSGRDSFERELRALGYVNGKNIAFEYRYADDKPDRLPALAEELIRLRVDLLYVVTLNAALAAKNATGTIPIVFNTSADPVTAGLVDSLARPGGNITGFTYITEVLAGKRLELLKETVPKLSRVALLWNPKSPGSAQEWKESQLPARELGLQLHSMEVRSADKLDSAFKEAIKVRSTALTVTQDSLFVFNQKRIADLATKNRLPAIYPRGDYVGSGGLVSYGADQTETFRRLASMVDKILKGTKPADIPVEQPKKFELVINLKTAKQINVTIPPEVLARANRIIR